jgi:lipopolysaccharide heptosyltransferase II
MKSIVIIIYLNLRKYLVSIVGFFFGKRMRGFRLVHGVKKILFIRIDRIGDLVLSTPALKALKQTFPRSQVVVLASLSNHSLLLHNPYVDKVFVYDHTMRLRDRMRIIRQLRAYRFDLAIDPYTDYELRTALIAFLSSAKKRVGYPSYGRELFFNVNAPKVVKDKHFIDLTLDVLKPLGVNSKGKKPEIFLTEDERKWARKWLTARGGGKRAIVGLHPGGHYETQRWLPERFADVAYQLKKNEDYNVIIFGGAGDEGLVGYIRSMTNAEVLTYVADDLRRFAALLCSCCILICNNSGPLHMSVALDIPTISFMGPTDKDRWVPIGDIHRVLRIDDLPCIGCNLGYCETSTHDCMSLITSSMVIENVKDILGSNTLTDGVLL